MIDERMELIKFSSYFVPLLQLGLLVALIPNRETVFSCPN